MDNIILNEVKSFSEMSKVQGRLALFLRLFLVASIFIDFAVFQEIADPCQAREFSRFCFFFNVFICTSF